MRHHLIGGSEHIRQIHSPGTRRSQLFVWCPAVSSAKIRIALQSTAGGGRRGQLRSAAENIHLFSGGRAPKRLLLGRLDMFKSPFLSGWSSTATIILLFRNSSSSVSSAEHRHPYSVQATIANSETHRVLGGVTWMVVASVAIFRKLFAWRLQSSVDHAGPREAALDVGRPQDIMGDHPDMDSGSGRTSSSVVVACLQFVFWPLLVSEVIRLVLQSTSIFLQSNQCRRQLEFPVVSLTRLVDEHHEQTARRFSWINVLICF